MENKKPFALTKDQFKMFVGTLYGIAGAGMSPKKGEAFGEHTFRNGDGTDTDLAGFCGALAEHDARLADKVRVFFTSGLDLVKHIDSKVSG